MLMFFFRWIQVKVGIDRILEKESSRRCCEGFIKQNLEILV